MSAEKKLGLVLKSTGSWYLLEEKISKETFQARIKGVFRIKNIKNTNPIAVGDWVDFVLDKDGIAVIHHIHPRENYIIRKSVNLSKRTHIIASNIDLAFLIVTVKNPKIPLGFIDRFLVTTKAYGIQTLIVFNKVDMHDEPAKLLQQEMIEIYQKVGYTCLETSATENIGIEVLKEAKPRLFPMEC
ncbi:MAG: hypothetical protein C4K58_04995 [Flavobacteriaceae bacterium]|nr:MAG: hypothetical protein C4K58_04995 [Flavobacteriaceae bacterium]